MKLLPSLCITLSLLGMTWFCQATPYPFIHPGTFFHNAPSQKPISDTLQRYVGSYELAPGQQLTISLTTTTLYITPPNETTKSALKPVGDNEFVVEGEEAHLFFKQAPTGKVTSVEIRFGNGASAVGKKM